MLRRTSSIPIKNAVEIARMRDACRIAATILAELEQMVEPGVTTYDLDQESKKLMDRYGATSACYNYRVGSRIYPAYSCISVNEEVVHGIGSLKKVLREGDIVTLDVNIDYEGYIGDNARTIAVGTLEPETRALVDATEEALQVGITQARPGKRVGDISASIQEFVESRGYSIVRDFVGHGVGRSMHEEPQIPNFGRRGTGGRLDAGMTLAIEPMVNMGKPEVDVLGDGWTAVSRDGLPTAHFEHTVLITQDGPEILTVPEN